MSLAVSSRQLSRSIRAISASASRTTASSSFAGQFASPSRLPSSVASPLIISRRNLATSAADSSSATSSSSSPSSTSAPTTSPTDFDLKPWSPFSQRTGVIARKRGMTALWNTKGERIPVTVLQLDNVQVIRHSPPAAVSAASPRFSSKPVMHSLQLGATDVKPKNCTKSLLGHVRKALEEGGLSEGQDVKGKRIFKEFQVTEDAVLPVGTTISAAHFVPGQFVDVTANSIGKGFAGVMKRHGFAGLKASHGVSLTHRSAGSTGQHQDPGRVLPGKKMAGHMGTTRTTVQNLKILRIDTALNLVFVKGHVPGFDDAHVMVKDSKKKVQYKGMANVRKGLGEDQWLTGGVKTLPFPAMSVQMAKKMSVPDVVELEPQQQQQQ